METIYLVQPLEFIGTSTYKFGRSSKNDLSRCKNGYKPGSRFLCIFECINSLILENNIKKQFNNLFKLKQGLEYFEGDEDQIYEEFIRLVSEHKKLKNNIIIDDKNDKIDDDKNDKIDDKNDKIDDKNDKIDDKNDKIDDDKNDKIDDDKNDTIDDKNDKIDDDKNDTIDDKNDKIDDKNDNITKNKNNIIIKTIIKSKNNMKKYMVEYVCITCNKTWTHKNDYTKHMNKKKPCKIDKHDLLLKKIEEMEKNNLRLEKKMSEIEKKYKK